MPRVLGIDAAHITTGWGVARVDKGLPKHISCGALTRPTAAEVMNFVKHWAKAIDAAVIEEPYYSPAKGPETFRLLSEATGRWRFALELAGVPVRSIKATNWQMGLLRGLIGKGSRREQCKAAARTWCRQVLKVVPGSQDATDALCLACWEGLQLRLAKRARAA